MKRFWTKATTLERGTPRRSVNWVTARRAWFKIFDDRVECGDWTIPYQTVERAVLYSGRVLFMTAPVLELRAQGKIYQFGFNPWVHLEQHLPLELERESVRFGYSPFSMALRLIVIVYIGWRLLSWLM